MLCLLQLRLASRTVSHVVWVRHKSVGHTDLPRIVDNDALISSVTVTDLD